MKKLLTIFSILLFASAATLVAQNVNVTFEVDMGVQISKGNFDPSSEVVTIPGGFNNWLNTPPENSEKTLDDADGDSIYTKTISMAVSNPYEYKYNIGLGWDGKDEFTGNRSVEIGTNDTTIAVSYFNNETIGGNATVTFNVDMELVSANGFDPSTDMVYIAGSFTDWATSAIQMTDLDSDSIYTLTVDALTGGDELAFKFIYGDTTTGGSIEWESIDDRKLFIIDGEQDFTAYWNDEEPGADVGTGTISFAVDLSVFQEVGIFDENTDSVRVYGQFNGWGPNDPIYRMNQDFLATDLWFVDVPFENDPLGVQFYKYFLDTEPGEVADSSKMWTDGWERPLSTGGGNRAVSFDGDAQKTVPEVYIADVHPDYVIEDGKVVTLKFSVDMTYAQTDLTFDSAQDTVWWVSEQASFIFTQDWVDTDNMRVLMMTDDNSDMVYEGELTVKTPSWNGFLYRYAYSRGEDWVHEPSGFGDFAYRARYCGMDAARSFVQPYSAPQDSWIDTEDKSSESEMVPPGYDPTSIQELNLVVDKFELSQNFPNPFNPTTNIVFNIPTNGLVSLKIYNLLGEEVNTLINQEMNKGSYQVNFDASNLSSGIYFYSLISGNYNATKKMILLK